MTGFETPRVETRTRPGMPQMPLEAEALPVQVPEPMSVVWQGVELAAVHWDVHGFTLQDPFPRVMSPAGGRVFDVTLLIGRGGTRIEMRVQVRAERVEDATPTRFIYIGMDRAQSEVLHRIVDHVVSNQAMSLTRLLNETEETRARRHETGEKLRSFRVGFQLSVAALVLAVAGMMTWSSFSTVRARYAAVTVGATSVSVPVSGVVSQLAVSPGQQVAEGDVLGYVRPANHDDRLALIDDRRRALEAEQAEWRLRQGTMRQMADVAVQGNSTERDRLEEALRLAERRLSVERAQFDALRSTGLPTAERQRERARQEAVVLRAENELLELRSRHDALARNAVLAPMGVMQSDLRSGTTTLEIADARLSSLSAEIAALYEREERALHGEPILSPCDCIVQQIDRRPGEWAQPNDQLAVLVGSEAPAVHALVLAENARRIELGQRARIELADGTRLNGRVVRMNYEARWPGYTGLQDSVFAADRYARVEIVPDSAITAPVGMVAQVRVHTNGLLAAVTGMVGL